MHFIETIPLAFGLSKTGYLMKILVFLTFSVVVCVSGPAFAVGRSFPGGEDLSQAQSRFPGPALIRDKGRIVYTRADAPSRVEAESIPGELVVKFRGGLSLKIRRSGEGVLFTGIDSADRLSSRLSVNSMVELFPSLKKSSKSSGLRKTYLLKYGSSISPEEAAALYADSPEVIYAEPNFKVEAWLTPDDPYFSTSGSWSQDYRDMWGLVKIGAEDAWDITTGDSSVVVAVIDTGIDYDHPDLAANMWTNPGEVPDNDIDDDGNGYVDDYYGWDFFNNDNDPLDDFGHGTHCAGTVAAVGNNGLGVIGVAWNCKVMAVKFLSTEGGSSSGAAQALVYAADNGAQILSNSWGGSGHPSITREAIEYAHESGCVIIAAAGNDSEDVSDYSPAGENRVIAVASTDHNDIRSDFSNYGEKIDVAAPGGDSETSHIGRNILSLRADDLDLYGDGLCIVGEDYYRCRGTSMACPHVAGLAALILSHSPSFSNEQVRQALHRGRYQSWDERWDTYLGFGRIDACESLGAENPADALITSPQPGDVLSGASTIMGSALGPGFQSYSLALRIEDEWITLHESTTPVDDGLLGNIDTTLADDGEYTLQLLVHNSDSSEDVFCMKVEIDNFEISYPTDWDCISLGETVSIEGSVPATDLDHYTLEWCPYYTFSWSTDGVVLAGGGLELVEDGILGTWDTGVVGEDDRYRIRLTVYRENGNSFSITVTPVVSSGFHQGWPWSMGRSFYVSEGIYIYSNIHAGPAVDDISGSCGAEIFIPGSSGDDSILNGFDADRESLAGWPVQVENGGPCVVLADLDGDGEKEIILNAWDEDINIFKPDGTVFPGWASSSVRFRVPSVGDVDRDGEPEIVGNIQTGESPDLRYWIGVWERNGDPLPGWPQEVAASDRMPPALGDLDLDGDLEIVVANGDSIYAWHADGEPLSGWPVRVEDNAFEAPPVLADLDNDGTLEVIATTFYGNVYAWDYQGSVYWEGDTSWIVFSPPAVGDLNGDGYPEVVVTSYNYTIHAFQPHGGGELPGWPVDDYYSFYGGMRSAPAIADVNGDGSQEVVIVFTTFPESYLTSLVAIDSGGNILEDWSKLMGGFTGMYDTTPAVLDHDGDGLLEVSCLDQGMMYMWDLAETAGGTVAEWPHYQHDASHRGQYIPKGLSCGTCYPATGTVLTPFVFSVTYREEGTSQPESGAVVIDGSSFPMQGEEQKITGERVFKASAGLAVGEHSYHFEFSEGGSAYRYPPAGELPGPCVEDSPTLTPTPSPTTTVTPTSTLMPTSTPSPIPPATPTATLTPMLTATPTVSPTASLTPVPSPSATARSWIYDYDGDGTSDIAIFRSISGLWAVRGITRTYFGRGGDLPVPGDYDGDGLSDVGIFRDATGLWALRNLSRIYFGASSDRPVPGDYDGDGVWECGIFRPSSSLWAIRGVTRLYFGGGGDRSVPADYDGNGLDEIGIFRETVGLWASPGLPRVYFGAAGDIPVTR